MADNKETSEKTNFNFEWNPCDNSALDFLGILPIQAYSPVGLKGKIKVSTSRRQARLQQQQNRNHQFNFLQRDERRLREAVESGDNDLAEDLLRKGVDPCAGDQKQRTPLHVAAAKGDANIVKALLDQGADPNKKDMIGNTPLHLAACTNQIKVVTLLLKAGTDVNALDNLGKTPLHLALSRLRLIKSGKMLSNQQLKEEVSNIVDMMNEYLGKTNDQSMDDDLQQLQHRLQQIPMGEGSVNELSDLLENFSKLRVDKTTPDG